jgi:hypothetical protein
LNKSVDTDLKQVLQRWWGGQYVEDNGWSDNSPLPPSITDGHMPRHCARQGINAFLKPYLFPLDGRKCKSIPECIFDIPMEQQNLLREISVTGLDPDIHISPNSGHAIADVPGEENLHLLSTNVDPILGKTPQKKWLTPKNRVSPSTSSDGLPQHEREERTRRHVDRSQSASLKNPITTPARSTTNPTVLYHGELLRLADTEPVSDTSQSQAANYAQPSLLGLRLDGFGLNLSVQGPSSNWFINARQAIDIARRPK